MSKSEFKFDVTRTTLEVKVDYSDYYDEFGGVPELYNVIWNVEKTFADAVPEMELVSVDYQDSNGENYYFNVEFKKSA